MRELLKLSEGNSKDSAAAKLGYVLVQQKDLKMLPGSGHVDDEIVDMVEEHTVVATQDKNLKERVKNKGAAIITMRQRHKLIFEV